MNKTIQTLENATLIISQRPTDLHINLKEIIRYGTLNGISKSLPVSTAAAVLPKPDYIDEYRKNVYDLYYGEVIFNVENDRIAAVEIPVEDGYIDGGDSAYTDYWHFEDTEDITLLAMQAVLSNEGIPFRVKFEPQDDEVVYLVIPQSGVTLSFWADESGNTDDKFNYKLSYINL